MAEINVAALCKNDDRRSKLKLSANSNPHPHILTHPQKNSKQTKWIMPLFCEY